jgi:hypothetical protein
MSVSDLLDRLQDLPVAQAISSGIPWKNLFPALESAHVLCLTLVVGSIVMLDLRLLGLSARDSAVSRLSREVLPWTWTAFALATVAGALLFISKAHFYFYNTQYQLKFLCMFLAFANMMIFHFGVYRRVTNWDHKLPPPLPARIAGGVSISLWIAVIFFGRWVGFEGFSD